MSPQETNQTKRKVSYGELVKSLALDKGYDHEFTQDEWTTLLSHMPFLKKIDLKDSRHTAPYLKSLFNILDHWNNNNNSDSDMIGFMDRLEEVCIDTHQSSEDLTKDNFKLCYALRKTLTHLSLHHFGIMLDLGNHKVVVVFCNSCLLLKI